jgi:cyclic pyranopterin phosphate synthase
VEEETMMSKKKTLSAGMVDIGKKDVTRRVAVASGTIRMGREAFAAFVGKGSPKGDVLETARVAGIMAAKSTPQIVPLCHPLQLNAASVNFKVDKTKQTVTASAEISCAGRTGVEMEALTAVSAALLTIYDMMKWADKAMTISDIKLLSKSGGKSGDFKRDHGR